MARTGASVVHRRYTGRTRGSSVTSVSSVSSASSVTPAPSVMG